MKFLKWLWGKLLNPHWLFLFLFYLIFIATAVTSIIVAISQSEQTTLHYLLYFLSAIELVYFVYTIVKMTPKIKGGIINMMMKFKFTRDMLNDYSYRTIIIGTISFVFNVAYMIFMAGFAFYNHSVWYISITIYYLVLSLVKGNIFYYNRQFANDDLKQTKVYMATGIMFILLTFALSGIIVLIYKSNMYFEYAELVLYAVAFYTFVKLTLAIINIFKAKKQDSLYIQSIRNVNLASALVSIVVLQVAMFQAFSPENNTSIANGITGAGISAIILAIGITMIVKASKSLKNRR